MNITKTEITKTGVTFHFGGEGADLAANWGSAITEAREFAKWARSMGYKAKARISMVRVDG